MSTPAGEYPPISEPFNISIIVGEHKKVYTYTARQDKARDPYMMMDGLHAAKMILEKQLGYSDKPYSAGNNMWTSWRALRLFGFAGFDTPPELFNYEKKADVEMQKMQVILPVDERMHPSATIYFEYKVNGKDRKTKIFLQKKCIADLEEADGINYFFQIGFDYFGAKKKLEKGEKIDAWIATITDETLSEPTTIQKIKERLYKIF